MKRKKISLLLTAVLTAMLLQVEGTRHLHVSHQAPQGHALFGASYR